ncbi:MAG: transcription-repair coupling factor, partial [Hungatella sp.]
MSTLFANPLKELIEYEELDKDLNRGLGPIQVSGCMDSQKVHLMHEAGGTLSWKLVITYDDSRAKEIYEDFRCFREDVWLYPAKDLLFYNADIHGNLMTKQRMQVLRHLIEKESGVVVTTLDGLMDHLLPLAMLEKQSMRVKNGQSIQVEEWKKRLVALGYERMAQVDGMGQFSIRGGIIDIFPLTEELPLRIELWDDEVDSIRSFDLESQRSVEQLDEALIYPATELVLTETQITEGIERIQKAEKKYEKALRDQSKTEEAHRIHSIVKELTEGLREGFGISGLDSFLTYFCRDTVSFFEYFSPESTAVFLDEPARLKEKGETVELEFRESMMHRLEKGYLLPEQTALLYSVKETFARLKQ